MLILLAGMTGGADGTRDSVGPPAGGDRVERRVEVLRGGITISIERSVRAPRVDQTDKYREIARLRELGDEAFESGRHGLAQELLNTAVRKNEECGGVFWPESERKLSAMCDRVRNAIEQASDADLLFCEAELRRCLADAQVVGETERRERQAAREFHLDLMEHMRAHDWDGAKNYIAKRIDDLNREEPQRNRTLLNLVTLKDAYLDMWILAGPDPEMFTWVRDNIDDLRWDAVERCVNVKRLAGMDIDGFEAVTLWQQAIRGVKSGLLFANHELRERIFEGILQDITRRYKTERLVDYVVKNWGKASRETWTRVVPSLRVQTPLKRAGWSMVYQRTWLHGHLDDYYRLQNVYDSRKGFRNFGRKHFGEMENEARVELGLPGVGKGWIGQDMMVQMLEEAFGKARVKAEGTPPWLERQRFDAWIPSQRLAVEYMGQQHYEPVDFFGGAKGSEATRRRDEIKKRKAAENGVIIEYVRFDEDIATRVEEIKRKYKR